MGSIPFRTIEIYNSPYSSVVERFISNEEVVGSIPAEGRWDWYSGYYTSLWPKRPEFNSRIPHPVIAQSGER